MVIRVGRWVVSFLAGFVGTAAVFAALVGWALAAGGITATAVIPYVERALTPADGRFQVHLDGARLHWGNWDRAPNIRVQGVRVKGPDGEAVTLPELIVAFSARAFLAHGSLAPTRIVVRAPRLEVARHEDGSIGLRGISAGRPFAPEDEERVTALVRAALAAFAGPPRPDDPLGHLDEVRVVGGRVLLDDQISGLTLAFNDATLVLARSPAGLSGRLDLELEQAGHPATVQAVAEYRTLAGEGVELDIDFQGLHPVGLAALAPALPLNRLDLRLDGRLELAVDAEGGLSPVGFEVAGGAGRILPSELLPDGLAVDQARLRGSLDGELAALQLDEATLSLGDATLRARAVVEWDEPPLAVWVEAELDRLRASELARYWPPQLVPRAREWVLANVSEGTARDGRVELQLGAADLASGRLPEEAVSGRFAFDGVTVRYLGGLPPATGVAGEARFTADRIDLTLAEGRVGRVRGRGGSVALTDIALAERRRAVVEIDAVAPLPDALALVDHPPLRFATKAGIDPAATSGEAEAKLRVEIPLVRDLAPDMVKVAADARLSGARVRGLMADADLTDGALRLRIDNAGLDMQGAAALAGVPVTLAWHEGFAPDGPPRRYRVAGRLDAADLRALGLEPDDFLADGDLGVEAIVVESRNGDRRAEIAIDLERAALTVPQLAWSKPVGAPGRLTFTAAPSADRSAIELADLTLTAPELWATGRGRLAAATLRPEALEFERFVVGETLTAVRWRLLAGGGHELELDAETLDLRPLLAAGDGDADDGERTAAPLRLHASADRVLLPGGALSRVVGVVNRDAVGWRTAEVVGRLSAAGGGVELRLDSGAPDARSAGASGRRLTIRTDDAGALLRTAGFTSALRGGTLKLDAAIDSPGAPPLTGGGTLRLRGITVVEAPPLARLLMLASMTGIANLLTGRQGIEFQTVEVPFRFDEAEGVRITGARASSSQVGLTLKGLIAAGDGRGDAGRLDLRGTIVPLHDLNRALGRVPVIGTILAGGEDGAILAATYKVEGTRDEPRFSVNPLAVLAPGLLRRLVAGIIDGTHEPPTIDNNPHDDR